MITTLRNLFALALLLLSLPLAASHVTFYMNGHPDDWQLFMNPDAFEDLSNPNSKVVFIYLTSGDQNLRTGGQGTIPLYQARENGAVSSGSFASNLVFAGTNNHRVEQVQINHHPITKYTYKNAVHYFIRMPDVTDWQSTTHLDQMHRGPLPLRTIDGKTLYPTWANLVETVRAIMEEETQAVDHFNLNALDPDARYNPDDHPDHRNAGAIAIDACHGLKAKIKLFQGYATGMYPENLSNEEKLNESALFALAVNATIDAGYDNTWEPWHKNFIGKNYYRLYFDPLSLQSSTLPSFEGLPASTTTASLFTMEFLSPPGHSDADQNLVMQTMDRVSEYITFHKRHFNNVHLLIYAVLLLGGFLTGLYVTRRQHARVAASPPPVHQYA
ncbi:PIG-L family deacetylase [Hymenobacter metallicola]|uniref:PIG-L family deacetylase n=1 Tax=Hymenobacter metallicola TaxID=2563114 RepID=A0A4Z0Q1W0_9BACT|nr:PIG-L family deacetylase [Hymenobacter metallicola]TGE23594.1 hypothetical protein E5K02_20640 [Hymenobacter metallicola]